MNHLLCKTANFAKRNFLFLTMKNDFILMKKIILLLLLILMSSLLIKSQSFQFDLETWADSHNPLGFGGTKTSIDIVNVNQYSTSSHGGAYAVQLINEETSHKRFCTKPFNVVNGNSYTISFWVRGHGSIRTGLFDGRTTNYGYSFYNSYIGINSNSWAFYTQTVDAANDTCGAEFIFSILSTFADIDHIQIDDIQINASIHNSNYNMNIICGGNGILLPPLVSQTGTISYQWSPTTGLNNPNNATPIVNIINTTSYYVTATNGTDIAIDTVTVNIVPFNADAGIDKTLICGGSIQLDNVSSNYPGSGTLSYNWSPVTGLSGTNISNPVSTITSSITYTVTVTTDNGCTAIDDVTVQVDPLIINSPNVSSLCGSPVEIITTNNYTGTGQLTYSWQPTIGLSNPNISNPQALPINTTTYNVNVTTQNGCTATNSATVTINSLETDEICVVTVDTSTWKNKIMWEKSNSNVIGNYYIYKEVAANVYNYIGSVDY